MVVNGHGHCSSGGSGCTRGGSSCSGHDGGSTSSVGDAILVERVAVEWWWCGDCGRDGDICYNVDHPTKGNHHRDGGN